MHLDVSCALLITKTQIRCSFESQRRTWYTIPPSPRKLQHLSVQHSEEPPCRVYRRVLNLNLNLNLLDPKEKVLVQGPPTLQQLGLQWIDESIKGSLPLQLNRSCAVVGNGVWTQQIQITRRTIMTQRSYFHPRVQDLGNHSAKPDG